MGNAVKGFILVLCFTIFGTTAMAEVYYLRADGTASSLANAVGPHTNRAACMNLQNHNSAGWGDALQPGDVVNISSSGGVFYGSLIISASGVSANPIVYKSVGGQNPVINCSYQHDNGIKVANRDWVNISGPITIRNARDDGLYIYAGEGKGNHGNMIIDGITVNDSRGSGIKLAGFGSYPNVRAWIEQVTIRNSTVADSDDHGFAASRNSRYILFEDCTAKRSGKNDDSHGFTVGSNAVNFTWQYYSGGSPNTYRSRIADSMYITRLHDRVDKYSYTHSDGQYNSLSSGQWDQQGSYVYVNLGGANPSTKGFRGKYADPNNITFRRCIAEETYDNSDCQCEGHGFDFDGFARNSTVEYCLSFNNEGDGIVSNMGANNIVRYNVSHSNNRYGIRNQAGSDDMKIHNNTVVANGKHGIYVPQMVKRTQIRNNILDSNGLRGLVIHAEAINPVIGYNLSYNNISSNWGGIALPLRSTDIEQDPQFVNPASHNYKLKDNSPGRDSGVNLGLSRDFENQNVPYNVTPDMGAFEWHPEGGSPQVPDQVQNLRIITLN